VKREKIKDERILKPSVEKRGPQKTRKHETNNNFFIHFKKINQIIKIKKGRKEERGKS
jgi:hypothetical protein